MAKWLPPHGFTARVQHMDASVDATYKMSFTNFTTGQAHASGGKYFELISNERIRYTDQFDDASLPGEMITAINIRPLACGTDQDIVQEGIPGVIPEESCYLGWQDSLVLLAQLVEAEIRE